MSRRVSAGELELRWKLKHWMQDFFDEMKSEMMDNLEYKGDSWKTCKKPYLLKKLQAKIDEEDWVALANYCFMLRDRELNKT